MISVFGASPEEKKLIESTLTAGLALMGASVADIDVTMVGRARIRTLNRELRGVDRVTDVLSFPSIDCVTLPLCKEDHLLDVDPATGGVSIGSIVICRVKAREQAAEYGHSFSRELAYLAVHGMLHLLSFDHMNEREKTVMRQAEEKILSALDIRR